MSLRVLVAYSRATIYTQVHLDYILSLKQFSRADVRFVHCTNNVVMDFDFDGFDAIFHSFDALLNTDGYLSSDYRRKLRHFRGVKIVALQDEYTRTNTAKRAIAELGFQVVLTTVRQDSLDYVYPRAGFSGRPLRDGADGLRGERDQRS